MTAGLALNLLALAGVAGWILRQAYPATEAVRLRNAFLVEASKPDDFSWTPATVPEDFKRDRRPPKAEFIEIVRALGVSDRASHWEKALMLSGHLTERAEDLGSIQADLLTTYRRIRGGHGYCADFVKVFLALAGAAGIFARQWAFSFDGYGGHGHTFVEVFDPARGKWLFLDVYNNFHVVDSASEAPLSAFELRDRLDNLLSTAHFRANGPGRAGFIHDYKALDYYQRGAAEWYLWWGNEVFSIDANPWLPRLSGWLGRLIATLFDLERRIRILPTPSNARAVASLLHVRSRMRIAGFAFFVLLLLLTFQLFLAWKVVHAGTPR